jgi:hypothetical protein
MASAAARVSKAGGAGAGKRIRRGRGSESAGGRGSAAGERIRESQGYFCPAWIPMH